MKIVIDRIEKGYAVVVLEDDTLAHLPDILLPQGAKEGSVITIECDVEETIQKQNSINEKMNKIFGK